MAMDPFGGEVDRFPLTAPAFAPPPPGGARSSCRPFGLRSAPPPVPGGVEAVAGWVLCPVRQIALTADGTPVYRTVVAMTMKTTGPSTDGGPSTGGEEYRPD